MDGGRNIPCVCCSYTAWIKGVVCFCDGFKMEMKSLCCVFLIFGNATLLMKMGFVRYQMNLHIGCLSERNNASLLFIYHFPQDSGGLRKYLLWNRLRIKCVWERWIKHAAHMQMSFNLCRITSTLTLNLNIVSSSDTHQRMCNIWVKDMLNS